MKIALANKKDKIFDFNGTLRDLLLLCNREETDVIVLKDETYKKYILKIIKKDVDIRKIADIIISRSLKYFNIFLNDNIIRIPREKVILLRKINEIKSELIGIDDSLQEIEIKLDQPFIFS